MSRVMNGKGLPLRLPCLLPVISLRIPWVDPVQKLINSLSFKLRLCFTNGFPHKLTIPKQLDKIRIDKCKHMLWPFENIDDGRCLH